MTLAGPQPEGPLPPYAQVLLDLLDGGGNLSVGAEEAEEAWRILDPVRRAWDEGRVPLQEYAAGSAGPTRE
jgi:glucose-6-phosphate 1-dehydrogenase